VPFAAELEVEPPHVTDSFSEGLRVIDEARPEGTGSVERESPACPVRLRVTWRSGFATRAVDAPTACPGAEARLAQIDDDGEIRAVPAPRAQRARPEP
jgi:hypothetical protein